jgi:hypothetical protein
MKNKGKSNQLPFFIAYGFLLVVSQSDQDRPASGCPMYPTLKQLLIG